MKLSEYENLVFSLVEINTVKGIYCIGESNDEIILDKSKVDVITVSETVEKTIKKLYEFINNLKNKNGKTKRN
ncbi:MAG: hypothetical protein BV457_00085 [Thermoplasmata archaeon M9B1D]|nr:MAG: hypothetical protein BV457_00085 [Thermoplasmata archaeon M9B1D]PNX52237.1 MAG: hypothetical protein BV456_00210 [Thermoplasmata archaeon M8B2D]